MWQCCVRLCLIFDFISWLIWWFMWFAFVFESCWSVSPPEAKRWTLDLMKAWLLEMRDCFEFARGKVCRKMGKVCHCFFPGKNLVVRRFGARLGLGDVGRAGRACGSMLELGESRRWGESSERSHRAHFAHNITSRSHHLIVTFWLDLPASLHAFQFRPQVKVSCFSAKKSRWISKVKTDFLKHLLLWVLFDSWVPTFESGKCHGYPGSVTVLRCFTCSNDRLQLSRINHWRREILCNAALQGQLHPFSPAVSGAWRDERVPWRRWGIFLAA